MKTMEQMWKEFAAAVVPKNASLIQRQEMRRAFYAGGWAVLMAVFVGTQADVNAAAVGAANYYTALEAEMIRFNQEVAAGRA